MTIALTEGIQLYSGTYFDYGAPERSDVTIEDIALALSHVCRFAGHVSRFYSVAQHCVNASRLVAPQFAFTALMHDTAEAVMNDIPTPLKITVPAFKDLEVRIEQAMSSRFGFQFPLPAAVKIADLQMLKLERDVLKPSADEWEILAGIQTEAIAHLVDMSFWDSWSARQMFLKRYEELRP